jgi:hypothetical protein
VQRRHGGSLLVIEIRRAAAGRDANDLSRVSDSPRSFLTGPRWSCWGFTARWLRAPHSGRPSGVPAVCARFRSRAGAPPPPERRLETQGVASPIGWTIRRYDATIVSTTSAGPLRSVRDRRTQVGRRDRRATPADQRIVHGTRRISATPLYGSHATSARPNASG